jgi:hypothetical protein
MKKTRVDNIGERKMKQEVAVGDNSCGAKIE